MQRHLTPDVQLVAPLVGYPLQIPVWKFRDNQGWIVHPEECYHLYQLLRDEPDPMVHRVARFCRRCVTNGGFAGL